MLDEKLHISLLSYNVCYYKNYLELSFNGVFCIVWSQELLLLLQGQRCTHKFDMCYTCLIYSILDDSLCIRYT